MCQNYIGMLFHMPPPQTMSKEQVIFLVFFSSFSLHSPTENITLLQCRYSVALSLVDVFHSVDMCVWSKSAADTACLLYRHLSRWSRLITDISDASRKSVVTQPHRRVQTTTPARPTMSQLLVFLTDRRHHRHRAADIRTEWRSTLALLFH